MKQTVQVVCPAEKLGTEYGAWTLCPVSLNNTSLVYSFGIGEDISFDLALVERFGAKVFAFDPTPKALSWLDSQALPEKFRWFDFGLADFDGTADFYLPENPEYISCSLIQKAKSPTEAVKAKFFRLTTIMEMLGHSEIAVLKMDVEGMEYRVIDDILGSNISIGQILVEFHHRFKGMGIGMTEMAIKKLNQRGYRVFAVSPNGAEYSFISGCV